MTVSREPPNSVKTVGTIIEEIQEQVIDLCHIHDHITRVIANLDIDPDWFAGYDEPDRATFELVPIVRMFLYQHARDFTQSELARRLQGAAYLYVRFGLGQPLSQQTISHNWRRRFGGERGKLKQIATHIREICDEHEVTGTGEPALDSDDVRPDHGIGEDQIMEAVHRATDLGFSEFTDPRASNATYSLQAYFERQGYLTMAAAGTTTKRRRFARLSSRSTVPHGSTHNRTMKKIATPEPQLTIDAFQDGDRIPDWKRIRDTVLPAFHAGVDNMLDEIAGSDRSGIREPVIAAIDITTWPYWPSPFREDDELASAAESVVIERDDGSTRTVAPKADYPEMVSGTKRDCQRAYKFATLSIVAQDTPIVLAIEPVRDRRWWESEDIETRTRGALVDRLLDQAQRHVEINKVFADREFDSYEVRHVIDQHDAFYVIGKRRQAAADRIAIQQTVAHSVADVSVEHATLTYDEQPHDVSFIYVPKDIAKDEEAYIDGTYAIFTVNAHVSPDRAMGLATQYRHRWMIENEYKTIKKHYLPTSASSDYRIRWLYFTIGVLMYNVWRLTNFLLRAEVACNLGEDPPLLAGEIVELVGFCLFDPGG